MTKVIKDTLSNIFSSKTQKKKDLPDNKKIIRSKRLTSDEYGYFNRMENL